MMLLANLTQDKDYESYAIAIGGYKTQPGLVVGQFEFCPLLSRLRKFELTHYPGFLQKRRR